MNANTMFLRLINKTRKFYGCHDKFQRICQHTAKKCLSTNVSVSQIGKEKEVFHDVLPGIIDSLVSSPKFAQLPEVGDWVKQVLDYNLMGGKKSRGLTTVFAYEMLEKPENITEDTMMMARTLGWCLEMLHAYFLVVDDIMDGSTTRRGMPCWYRMPNVGLGAINDSILMNCAIYDTLHLYLGKTPHYVRVIELFNDALMFTSVGQHIDYTMAHRNKNDYSLFTIERYNSIADHKTTYYTFKLPIYLGLLLTNKLNDKSYELTGSICEVLGKLFQIQDDYLDCYGDEAVTGKIGTDIQEGKCSWLAVTALQHCNKAQREIFVENYAQKESEHVKCIKQLYEELNIAQLYKQEETRIYEGLVKRIRALPVDMSPSLFMKLLEMIYNRNQ